MDPNYLDYNYKIQLENKLTIHEAKKRGILNVEKGLYINTFNNTAIKLTDAIKYGYIGTSYLINSNDHKKIKTLNGNTKNIIYPMENNKGKISTSTLKIDSIIDKQTGQEYPISDAINMGIINKYTSYNKDYNKKKSDFIKDKNIIDDDDISRIKLIKYKNSENSVIIEEAQEKCFQINNIKDPKTNKLLNLSDAIQCGLFDKDSGLFIEPDTNRKLNLNEAYRKGYLIINEESESKDFNKNTENKDSILRINVSSYKSKDNLVNTNSNTFLYEVNEIKETFMDSSPSKEIIENTNYDKINNIYCDMERIEHVIDDEDNYEEVILEDDDINSLNKKIIQDEEQKIKRRDKRIGLRQNILERRISSYYGGDDISNDKNINGENILLNKEPLIIDDVRHSAMLNIDGVTHVFNNELHIDSDNYKSTLEGEISKFNNDKLENASITSCVSSPLIEKNQQIDSDNNLNKEIKNKNRTVILVEDNLINSSFTEPSNKSYESNFESLKIPIDHNSSMIVQKHSKTHSISSVINTNSTVNVSNEFLTNSERAQFERVSNDQLKNNIYFKKIKHYNYVSKIPINKMIFSAIKIRG